MKPQTAFVSDDGTTVLKCPYCNYVRTVSVARFKNTKKVIKVRCSCRQSYAVNLELRKLFRKSTHLEGTYSNLSLDDDDAGQIIVTNVSMGGIGFKTIEDNKIEVDHELDVSFTLDDVHSSVIKKQVVVRIVQDKFVGCEFLHLHHYDKALGFYLLP